MKKIIVSALLAACFTSLAQYTYNGKAITEQQFNKLYEKFGKGVFTFKGEFYNLNDNKGTLKDYCGEAGMLDIKITNTDKSKKEANGEVFSSWTVPTSRSYVVPSGDGINYTREYRSTGGELRKSKDFYYIINLLDEDFAEKIKIPVLKLDKVKENYVNKMDSSEKLLARLTPATKQQFSEYLNKGIPFYLYDNGKGNTVVEQVTCNICYGRGKINNPSYDRKRMGSNPVIPCPTCKGTGLITNKKTVNIEPKLIVYQP